MKRQLSPEQFKEREARRASVRAFAKQISAMSLEERVNFAARAGLRTIEARELSPFNACLILRQNPNATVVGGFRQWLKQGRAVMKGQHGLIIWVPVGHKTDDGTIDEKTGFILGSVFDVSQTQEIETAVAA